jgi:hypothetical protein
MGEWVDRSAPPPRIQKSNLPGVANDSWIMSSRDLRDGIDVDEGADAILGDLFDEWFRTDPALKTATGE